MNELKRLQRNLVRRINYFNATNSTKFNPSSARSISTKADLQKIEKSFSKVQAKERINKGVKAINARAQSYGISLKTGNVKGDKSLKNARAKLEREIRKQKNFIIKQDKFVREVREYNAKLSLNENSKRVALLPRNQEELKKYKKVLANIKKQNIENAEKILGVPKGEELRKFTFHDDFRKAKLMKGYTYRDRVFLQTSIDEAMTSALPDLANLFYEGGESLVLELSAAGFSIVEFVYLPDGLDSPTDFILGQLGAALPSLSPNNRKLVERFIQNNL